jgi:hypothetical protein
MLKSDRLYFARFALDPEIEFDDIDLYLDDEGDEIPEDRALGPLLEDEADESFFEGQDDLEER